MPDKLDDLRRFYLPDRDSEPNLYEIWEQGQARGDSVTPSTYSAPYRKWIHDKLVTALEDHGTNRLLSLGSGNAVVEMDILNDGYEVLAVDALDEAVALARSKGLTAQREDVTAWAPSAVWPVIYADGLLGHLYTSAVGLSGLMTRIRSWLTDGTGRGTLIISNDSPRNGEPVQAAPGVPGFYWLSGAYLRDEALASGFSEVTVESFAYERPLSGERIRAVVTATAAERPSDPRRGGHHAD
ncbi:class I SAM-dependent methyltransferase [Streptomyces capitiformicae]|uniref:Uncharacterized protein n=1 Tax=Streptomyces capitiformicae TaxID=2014920 RepID=A0A918Z249_9ACTN|nr:class I SAM-dependent methyltransferase [Streptomyces capitiformicae]GHE34708.1 hypothetical protein GCM10017771_52450 [Streptomyces capitiformicae]